MVTLQKSCFSSKVPISVSHAELSDGKPRFVADVEKVEFRRTDVGGRSSVFALGRRGDLTLSTLRFGSVLR